MKTIIRTISIIIGLLGIAQDGLGTESEIISSWSGLLGNYSTKSGKTYTLKKTYTTYNLKQKRSEETDKSITFIIPKEVKLILASSPATGGGYCTLYLNDNVIITNKGTFINDNILYPYATVTINNLGTFYNSYSDFACLYVRYNLTINNVKGKVRDVFYNATFENKGTITAVAENNSITFSGNGAITNTYPGAIFTNGKNSSIKFSGGNTETPQIVTTAGTSSSTPGKIHLGESNSSITIGQHSILSFGEYGKFYTTASNGNVTLNGTIEIKSADASVDTTNMNISGSGTIDMSKIQECSDNVNLQRPLNLCGDSENNIPATFICGQSQ